MRFMDDSLETERDMAQRLRSIIVFVVDTATRV